MRGTSAESLNSLLDGLAQSTGDLAVVGDQLFAVVAVLDQSPPLRRLLTDPSLEPTARQQLAESVFGESVNADTLSLIRVAADSRWAAGRDFGDAIEIAGVESWAAASERAGQLSELESELFAISQTVISEEQLRRTIGDKAVAPTAKASLLADLFSTKVSKAALAIVTQAASSRTGSFERVIKRFAEQLAARRGRLVADVTAAYPLDDAELERLGAALKNKYGKEVQINLEVDPTVVGGISVAIGDEVVDATMSTRLEAARRALAG